MPGSSTESGLSTLKITGDNTAPSTRWASRATRPTRPPTAVPGTAATSTPAVAAIGIDGHALHAPSKGLAGHGSRLDLGRRARLHLSHIALADGGVDAHGGERVADHEERPLLGAGRRADALGRAQQHAAGGR